MSYDISLEIDTGNGLVEVVEVGNHTSNTGDMWFKALGVPLRDLHMRNAGETVALLEKAVKHMEENPSEYVPMNPPNGWGSYDTAMGYLAKLLRLCREHPKCTITIFA